MIRKKKSKTDFFIIRYINKNDQNLSKTSFSNNRFSKIPNQNINMTLLQKYFLNKHTESAFCLRHFNKVLFKKCRKSIASRSHAMYEPLRAFVQRLHQEFQLSLPRLYVS